ncbi:MAG: hypothetical protein IJQ08_07400 [Synergistaceae bacterium]|nr:hypothetical protein [Synergistaceae bacterium]
MKRFLSLSAVVIILVALTPPYVPAMSNEFGAIHVSRAELIEEVCRYCGKSRKEAGNSKCPNNPNKHHGHSFTSPGAPSK